MGDVHLCVLYMEELLLEERERELVRSDLGAEGRMGTAAGETCIRYQVAVYPLVYLCVFFVI